MDAYEFFFAEYNEDMKFGLFYFKMGKPPEKEKNLAEWSMTTQGDMYSTFVLYDPQIDPLEFWIVFHNLHEIETETLKILKINLWTGQQCGHQHLTPRTRPFLIWTIRRETIILEKRLKNVCKLISALT